MINLKSKKVLCISHATLPNIGGVEVYVYDLCEYLSKNDIEVLLLTSDISSNPGIEIVNEKFKILRIESFTPVKNYPIPKFWRRDLYKNLSLIYRFKPNYFITNTRFFFSSAFPLLYLKKRPFWIHIEHGSEFVNAENIVVKIISRIFDETLGKLILYKSNKIICVSNAVQKFLTHLTKKQTSVVYRGFHSEQYQLVRKKREIITFGYLGRFSKQKNIENAISAFIKINQIYKNTRFVIAGGRFDLQRIKVLSAYNIENIGIIKKEEVPHYLNQIDVFISPSISGGGLGTSLVEALLSNCIIISTPNEGAVDLEKYIKNRGIIVKNGSIEEIYTGIKYVIDNFKQINKTEYADPQKTFTFQKWVDGIFAKI